MGARRGTALARLALLALAFVSLPAAARAQEVLCDPGEREVRAVRFAGNATFSTDELSARVLTTPSSITRRYLRVFGARRCYPDIGLRNDVANLRAFYQNNGFYDTRVDTIVTTLSPGRVDITFRIAEGLPLILDSLEVSGLDAVEDRAAVLAGSPLRVGARVGRVDVIAEEDSITSRLRNLGYPRATVFRAFDTHPTEHRAEVSLDVQTGARARIGAIAVRNVGADGGPPSLQDSVVRKLLGVKRGDLYRDALLSQASRNLYNLALFRHVDVSIDTTFAHGDSIADLIVDLREDLMHQIDLEEGWGQLDCFRLSGLYTDKNFQGQARRFEFTARVSKLGYAKPTQSRFTRNLCYRHYLDNDSLASSKLNDYLGATLRWPTVTVQKFTPSMSVYTERQGQYQAYLRRTEFGLGAAASRELARQTPLRLGYNFEEGSTQAEPVVLCALFNRCTEEEQGDVQRRRALGIASASIQRLRTDNPVSPTRGYSAAIETRYSAPFLASDADLNFFKVSGDFAFYRPLFRGVSFAGRARGGLIFGGQRIDETRLPPPQERLYAGGPTSVRGFQQNQLGPQIYLLAQDAVEVVTVSDSVYYLQARPGKRQDRSIPSGGNLLTVLNAELRIRDPFFPELLQYAPFIDAGQVWITQISKNVEQPRLAVTPGLSVRYFSPVGPIQVNVGYNRYDPAPGAAYYLTELTAGQQNRPLLCVTAPGETPLLIVRSGNRLVQNVGDCPTSFAPPARNGFFRRLNLTLSIGTDF